MFGATSFPFIRSSLLYIRHWQVSCRFLITVSKQIKDDFVTLIHFVISTQLSPSTNLTWNFFLYIAIVDTPSAWHITDRRYVCDINDWLLTLYLVEFTHRGAYHRRANSRTESLSHMHSAIGIRNLDSSAGTAQDVKNTGKYAARLYLKNHVEYGMAIFMATFYGGWGVRLVVLYVIFKRNLCVSFLESLHFLIVSLFSHPPNGFTWICTHKPR
jgi:hypothetical protein